MHIIHKIMLMPGATEADAALAANVIVRASFDNVIPGNCACASLNTIPNRWLICVKYPLD